MGQPVSLGAKEKSLTEPSIDLTKLNAKSIPGEEAKPPTIN
jgi:hypothetical protein